MRKDCTIGLVVPFASDTVPEEGLQMYPGVRFVARGVGVRSLTPTGYDSAWEGILPAAEHLAGLGVDAVMVIGTSLTFYRGAGGGWIADFLRRPAYVGRGKAARAAPRYSGRREHAGGVLGGAAARRRERPRRRPRAAPRAINSRPCALKRFVPKLRLRARPRAQSALPLLAL